MPSATAPLITSLGLATSLGTGAACVAAAQRAGLSRRAELPDYAAFDPGPDMEAPVLGAPIDGFTDGFMHPGRWLRLAIEALDDLIAYGGLPEASDLRFWQRTGLIWALPEITFERFLWPDGEIMTLIGDRCTRPLLSLSGLAIRPENVDPLPMGSAATAIAACNMGERIARADLDRVVLLATDSWLDPLSMRVLLDDERVKSGAQPVGLCPGEAGAAILFEAEAAARARGAAAEARLESGAAVPGRWPAGDDALAARVAAAPEAGQRLAAAIRQALVTARVPLPFGGDVFLDLNGEEWRARVWGAARTLLNDVLDPARMRLILPAIELGDVGAAASATATCLSTRSFLRGYARGDRALVCTVAETSAAGALVLASVS